MSTREMERNPGGQIIIPISFINLVHGGIETGRTLVRDEQIKVISFTGSSAAGRDIRANAGLRHIELELGGNGPTIVCDDTNVDEIAPVVARN